MFQDAVVLKEILLLLCAVEKLNSSESITLGTVTNQVLRLNVGLL